MPLTPKRKALESELVSLLEDPNKPLAGKGLAKALANFSKGILPPTIGIYTGRAPSAAAYDSAPKFEKTKGIEDAINTFADFNALGMAPFAFQGTAPPPIKNLQRFFDIIKNNNGTVQDIAKFLSYAILANYTLGRSTFTPLSILIPTWNIPILPGAVRDEMDQEANDAKMRRAEQKFQAELEINDPDSDWPETEEFFERTSEGYD